VFCTLSHSNILCTSSVNEWNSTALNSQTFLYTFFPKFIMNNNYKHLSGTNEFSVSMLCHYNYHGHSCRSYYYLIPAAWQYPLQIINVSGVFTIHFLLQSCLYLVINCIEMWTHWPVFQFVELIHVIAGKLLVTDELLVFL